MAKQKIPKTPAVRYLENAGIAFEPRYYKYEEKGGTRVSARELGVSEHVVIKTLVMEDENNNPFIVLMHGDKEVSLKNMARILKVKSVQLCSPDKVTKHTGYLTGGTSPFGTKKRLNVFMEETILNLDEIFINGGKRGLLVKIASSDVKEILNAETVKVGING
ncbi:MAG: Cys-tRNA(Pro) deacylase [Flexistipes sinusarabici]|uniref:Cys-tRNA(Pro)/Cys-tRNA(Cys) deacylase n=1 Tax=Flexistipes sinusarabici TaxID=2352 RepID=A0A5D0MGI7_FLESI|nr:Cys-tRNA(Pro) deacylase [Flexistipes sinusarabici]TYB32814.1 MAG: Cys-tRNA(Pro) deacylase [Flexistipes sinusarabici]